MSRLKGTKTEKNILTAFAGESQARNKYDMFASIAKKEGYVQIQAVFEETARHEKEHAKRLFKFLDSGQPVEFSGVEFPAGCLGDTAANLKEAAAGENEEYSHMYPEFAKIAREEGFKDVALAMDGIAIAERYHEARYLKLLETLEKGEMFQLGDKVVWRCRNCGHLHTAEKAPELCPACAHKKPHFERLNSIDDIKVDFPTS